MENLTELPQDLPVPLDDGAGDRLLGISLPSIPLLSTQGNYIDLRIVAILPIVTVPRVAILSHFCSMQE
jgi:hypothetical protein